MAKASFYLVTKRPECARDLINNFCHVFNDDEPIPNLWLLVSVEDQKTYDERIVYLLQTNAIVRGLSMEPLLERVDLKLIVDRSCEHPGCLSHFSHPCEGCGQQAGKKNLHWAIVGFESGSGCRVPADANEIAHNIMVQCDRAMIPFFMKQMGGHPNKRANKEDIPRYLHRWSYPDAR